MNINHSIEKTLVKRNRKYHEESKCIDCKPKTKIRSGIWTTVDCLGESEKAGIPLYFDGENVLQCPYSHGLIVGSSGSGKSEIICKNIARLSMHYSDKNLPSFLITDLKGDITPQLMPHFIERGYRVRVLNMRNPGTGDRYNFLISIYDNYQKAVTIKRLLEQKKLKKNFEGKTYESLEEARKAARVMRMKYMDSVEFAITELSHIIVPVNDPKERTWAEGARTMLQGIIWGMLKDSELHPDRMTREAFTISNVCRVAFTTENDCEYITEWLDRAREQLCVENAISAHYGIRANITRDGYVTSLNNPLSKYAKNSIAMITQTTDEFDLTEIAQSEEPYAIFIITDDRQQTTNSICMMFLNNLLNELADTADRNPTHALKRDFVVLADEFANMPAMPNIGNKITTYRSRRIWLLMAVQSIQQLEFVYGKELSAIIEDNCDLRIFLGCNNNQTKEAFSHSMGQTAGVKTSFQISNDGSVAASKFTENVPVIRISDLDDLELGEFYVRSRQCRNMKSYMKPYFLQIADEPIAVLEEAYRDFDIESNRYDIRDVLRMEEEKKRAEMAERNPLAERFRRMPK